MTKFPSYFKWELKFKINESKLNIALSLIYWYNLTGWRFMTKEKIKKEKYQTDDQKEITRFLITLLIVIFILVGIYFFTRFFVKKDLNNSSESEITEGTINYTTTLIGSMLNKPEDEYYVIAYDIDNLRAIYYNSLISNYSQNEDALKVYYADISNVLNQKFYDPENINLDTDNISELKIGDLTLIRIRRGEIAEILNSEDDIAEALRYIASEDTEN